MATRYEAQALDEYGRAMPGAKVYIYAADGSELPIFDEADNPLTQPIETDTFGIAVYYANTSVVRRDYYFQGRKEFSEIFYEGPEDLQLRTDLATTTGSELIGYLGGTVAGKLAELPSILDYIPNNLHAAILNFTSTTDVTSYVNTALATGAHLVVPNGLFNITSLIPASKSGLIGLGRKSIINQLATAGDVDSVILVSGVTDVLIENLEIRGIISQFDHTRQTGTYPKPNNSEFNHGISIRADDAATTARITVRNCFFQDIRGDAILVFEADAGDLSEIDLLNNAGTNILRNGIAVVGGHRGRIKGAHFPICGYAAVDFEPEGTYSDVVEGWTVEDVYGPVVQVAANADTYSGRVKLRNIVTDGSLANTTPPYKNGAGVSYHDTTSSIRARNTIRLDIDGHYPKNHTGHAIFYVTDATPTYATKPVLQLKNFEYDATIGTSEATYNACVIWSPANGEVYIEDGKFTAFDDNQSLDWFGGDYTQQAEIKRVQSDGRLVVNAKSVSFENIKGTLVAARGLTLGCQKLQFTNCPFMSAGLIGYNTSSIVMVNSSFTIVGGGSGYGGTLGPVLLVNSTFGAITRAGYGLYSAAELTGWTAGTGTANKGAFAAYGGATMSGTYVQAEAQATNDAAKNASQRILALENAVRALTNMLGAS